MEIISLKTNARKTFTKKTLYYEKGLYTNRDSLELFLEYIPVFTEFFINIMFSIYILAILWDFSYFIFKI